MAVQQELWIPEVTTGLFRKNPFINFATDISEYVLNGKVVHRPQSGGAASAQRNRSTLPATAVQRADTDVTYAIDNFTSDPMFVTMMEQAELNYSKMQSMVSENGEAMFALAGDAILEYWARNISNTAGNQVVTTGSGKSIAGLTSTRKKLTAADLRTAQTLLDNQDVPMDDRYLIITPDMRQDLIEDADIKNIFFQVVDYTTGQLPIYSGFKILVRSKTIRLTNAAATILPDGGATLGTDNFSGIFWQKSCVDFSLGERKVFMNPDQAVYYGDVMSMALRCTGRNSRADKKGVGVLIQGA